MFYRFRYWIFGVHKKRLSAVLDFLGASYWKNGDIVFPYQHKQLPDELNNITIKLNALYKALGYEYDNVAVKKKKL